MSHPSSVTIFDQTNRALHLAGAVTAVATVATGFAYRFHGPGPFGTSHLVAAVALTLLFAAHVARVVLAWLERGERLTLLARAEDYSDGLRALLSPLGFAGAPPQKFRGYRQRLPYCAHLLLFFLLLLTGIAVMMTGSTASIAGADGLLLLAESHSAFGVLFLGALFAHLFFSTLAPGALWFNEALFTGERSWEGFAALHPDSVAEFSSGEDEAPPPEEEAGPSVEELLNEGNSAAKAGDYLRAAKAFDRALELYPGYPQALFNLGVCRFKLGQREEAARALELYLTQDAFGPASDRARAMLEELREGGGR